MSAVSMMVGAVDPSGAVFAVKVDTGPAVRVAVADNAFMNSPIFTAPLAVDAQGVAKPVIGNLLSATRYWWQVEDGGVLDTSMTGQFQTHPPLDEPASFTIAAASCAGLDPTIPGSGTELAPNRISNALIFDILHNRGVNENWLFFCHLGDIAYYDPGSGVHVPDASVATYRTMYDDILAQSRQAQLYRELPLVHLWDDHEFGPDNSDGTFAFKDNASQVYREREPHYPLSDPDAIYQAFQIGRVQFIASDVRYHRSPNSLPDGAGLRLDGVAANQATTPDFSSLDITGDIDIRAEVDIDDWANAAPDGVRATIISKWNSPNRSYWFGVENDGRLALFWSVNGTGSNLNFSTVSVPAFSGRLAVRGTLLADDEAGNHIVRFYTAPTMDDPWIALGDPVVVAGTTSIFSGTAQASVGATDAGTSRPFAGTIRRAQIRTGIGGSVVTNPDFSAQETGTTSFVDSTTKTWTVQGSAEIINKSMLGDAQKEWMRGLLANTNAKALVWLMPSQWLGTGSDTWEAFATERDDLVQMLEDGDWLRRTFMVYGDRHAAGLDSGMTNDWGGFPVMEAASLDARPSSEAAVGRFNIVPDTPGRNHYGTIAVEDLGSVIRVTMTVWDGTAEVGSFTKTVEAPSPPLPRSVVSNLIRGSHDVMYEARILETFQTGPDPTGTDIELLGGDVKLNGTAKIRGTAKLRVSGTFGQDGPVAFPRAKNRLLGPYGNEIFLRYGIDMGGGGVLWTPLGYYRITTVDQDDTASNPIDLNCDDRMKTIEESKLLEPRVFQADTTYNTFFDNLVLDIYPDAVIVFDDASGDHELGRITVIEENRYESLREAADSLGKVMYWNDVGILRIETPVVGDEIFWEVDAGFKGVLVEASRKVTRDDVYNAVVIIGEAPDGVPPVRAVAVDDDPTSPTRFGGPFGRIPLKITTPLVSTTAEATIMARQKLIRAIGAPFDIDFQSIVNPETRPYHVVRITHNDGNRDIHIIDSVTIPLDEDTPLRAATRLRSAVIIGEGDD